MTVVHPTRSEWLDLVFKEVAGYDALVSEIVDTFLVVLNRYEELCKYNIKAPRNVLLHGIPGTGKSHVVETICKHSKLHYHIINSPDIFKPDEGDSEKALFEAFQTAQRKAPCFLVFDQIDAIASNRDKLQSIMEKRVVLELADLLEENTLSSNPAPVFVIGITSRKQSLDPSLFLFSKFDRVFDLKLPTPVQRLEILKLLTNKMGISTDVVTAIASITHAFVPSDLQSLCSRALLRAIAESPQRESTVVTIDHFKSCLATIRPSIMSEYSMLEAANVEDIGGLDDILNDINATIVFPLMQLARIQKEGGLLRLPKGVLLYGPSGCGKTLLARSLLSARNHVNFISIQSTEIISKIVGESEKAIRNIFFNLRASAPCILFLDQLEAIARVRGFDSSSSNTADRILSCLLTEIDGISADNETSPVIVLGATSRPDLVDPAILRPGRFDTHIFVAPPNEENRLDILQKLTKKMAVEDQMVSFLPELAKSTDLFSGADLDSLCREAGLLCLREDLDNTKVTVAHFEAALKIVRPSLRRADYAPRKIGL